MLFKESVPPRFLAVPSRRFYYPFHTTGSRLGRFSWLWGGFFNGLKLGDALSQAQNQKEDA